MVRAGSALDTPFFNLPSPRRGIPDFLSAAAPDPKSSDHDLSGFMKATEAISLGRRRSNSQPKTEAYELDGVRLSKRTRVR